MAVRAKYDALCPWLLPLIVSFPARHSKHTLNWQPQAVSGVRQLLAIPDGAARLTRRVRTRARAEDPREVGAISDVGVCATPTRYRTNAEP
jgi:hypothetical protein